MSSYTDEARPMVSVIFEPEYRIRIEELCGIAHERQVLAVALPGPSPALCPSRPPLRSFLAKERRDAEAGGFTEPEGENSVHLLPSLSEERAEGRAGEGQEPGEEQDPAITRLFFLTDQTTNRTFPIQPSAADPTIGFLLIAIEPGESLDLGACQTGSLAQDIATVTLAEDGGNWILANGRLALRFAGHGPESVSDSGPVLGVRCLPGGEWRGSTAFDSRRPFTEVGLSVVELGPLRTVVHYGAKFAGTTASYEATFTLDAGADFVRIAERWSDNTPGEQVVWDFSGPDLPTDILRLDSTAGCAIEPLQYFYDHRICRLFAWTQQSQLSDLSDGFALTFDDGDAIGFVTLEGGSWHGNRLNHLEAWSRRWIGSDPASRRGVPDAAKRDVFPSPERILARGESRTTPHLNVEGWIGESGERTWALVATRTADLMPGAGVGAGVAEDRGCSVDRRHFEHSPDRDRDRRESSRLRRIHTQRGLLPLSTLANATFHGPTATDGSPSRFTYPNPILEEHMKHRDKDAPSDESSAGREERRKAQMIEALAARVYGFWEGGASGATNPVVSRDVAPRMLQFEYLAGSGQLSAEEQELTRAHFLFLAYLFGSDNYYPGMTTMLPADHPDSVEPTLEGMANQNFYTDVVNVCGMAAQVFPNHPLANAWKSRFGEHWARQLAYHMYPNSGVWEESHTYFQHVLHTMLPTLLRRREDGVGDAFADPSLQMLLRGAIRQIVPRDGRFGGSRYLAPFGDHSAGHASYANLYKPLAEAVQPHDPELAANLLWMHREMGGREETVLQPTAPPVASEYVEGLGYFLRGTDDEGQEFLLALRAGSAWGHHHHDEGSIQFWAKGLSLIVDAGFGEWSAGKRKFNDSGHSRWGLTEYPANNFRFRFNRGWITSHAEGEPFPYAVAHAPIYLQAPVPGSVVSIPGHAAPHRRAIVRVGPCAFLVVDVAETGLGQTVRFHIPETAEMAVADGGVTAAYGDDCALTLQSVLPEQPSLAVVTRDSLADGKSTLEVAATVPSAAGRSHAVYLIVADSVRDKETPRIEACDDRSVRLTGRGFDVRLEWPERNVLKLTNLNLNSGGTRERAIDLSAPARCVS